MLRHTHYSLVHKPYRQVATISLISIVAPITHNSLYCLRSCQARCQSWFFRRGGGQLRMHIVKQEAQLPQRNSASAAHMEGGLGPQPTLPTPPLATPMHMVESETRNKLTSSVSSTKRTLRWIGHSRSFKVILIGASRNLERCVVVMCNSCRRYFWSLRRYGNGKRANSSISTTPLKFKDVPARNAFEYLPMIYIARKRSHWPIFLPLILWIHNN